jgi:hypothetical protein
MTFKGMFATRCVQNMVYFQTIGLSLNIVKQILRESIIWPSIKKSYFVIYIETSQV